MWLLVQKELQGREQECREFHSLNVSSIIFCGRKETYNGESLTKIFFPQQLAVDRVPHHLD